MGDYKRFIILVAVLVIAHFSIHYYADREENGESEGKDSLLIYSIVISRFQLSSDYHMEDDALHIELYPTEYTQEILERWKWISEVFPEMTFPEEAIEQNDWLVVSREFTNGTDELGEIYGQDVGLSKNMVWSYILWNEESSKLQEYINQTSDNEAYREREGGL
ncbi:hypothetical protein HXA35_01755 [Bacillus sp. A301a_S52]|nr:hypothetical protein [Bacillus sp. A301a_S52]